jgi:aspartate/methionine/tyrosine aminotransferase
MAQARRQRRAAGLDVIDLTASNPTETGIAYPVDAIATALATGAGRQYEPVSFGLLAARAAVADYYKSDHELALDTGRIALTCSTSEAYGFAFKLLCDPGDNVLIAQPSYPLFDFLATLDGIELRPYPLFYDAGWHIDRAALAEAANERTRAVVVVHPNNPTGHYVSSADREWLRGFCREHEIALLVDEVFLDYPLSGAAQPSFLAEAGGVLTLVMSGLSKVAGLPQMKLAWLAVAGPEDLVARAVARLEVVADTYLSVSSPLQHALAELLEVRRSVALQIQARTQANLRTLDQWLRRHPGLERLAVEAGWYAMLRLPELERADRSAIDLLRETGVEVHAGNLFGMAGGNYWVVSLLAECRSFETGLERIGGFSRLFE